MYVYRILATLRERLLARLSCLSSPMYVRPRIISKTKKHYFAVMNEKRFVLYYIKTYV